MCRVIVFDNNRVYVDGVKGVIQITEENIRINAGKRIIDITGKGLYVHNMNNIEMIICGVIDGIRWLNK